MKLVVSWLLILFFSGTAHGLEVETSFSSKKSGPLPDRTNEREFTCSDTIYILIDATGLPEGVTPVEIHWIGPTRKRHELTEFEIYVDQPQNTIWAWLRLHPPSGTKLTRSFDPSYGMRQFIGKWGVKIHINNKLVDTAGFDVLC